MVPAYSVSTIITRKCWFHFALLSALFNTNKEQYKKGSEINPEIKHGFCNRQFALKPLFAEIEKGHKREQR